MRKAMVAAGALLALAGAGWPAQAAEPKDHPCNGRSTSLFVRASAHRVWLCRDGASDASYEVALGSGGIGKRSKGDKKTPLGIYELGKSKASPKYRSFIPIAYPTREQRRSGYSGTDVGIHGPDPIFSWEGTVDWTNGCIALKTNDALDALVAWIKKWQPRQIEIVE